MSGFHLYLSLNENRNKQMHPHYFNTYQAEDFAIDEIFLEIVAKGPLSVQSLKRQFPNKQNEIDLAVEMINKLKETGFQQSPEKKLEQWNSILKKQKQTIRLQFLKYAAAILLIAGAGSATFFHLTQQSSIERFASSKEFDNHTDATLIIANGQKIGISQKQSNIKYSADGLGVVVNDSSNIKQTVGKESYNQMIVPFGKRANLVLSDGTKVWMNSGSRLVYSPVFRGSSREVFLDGEAYFEVKKDENRPFFVRTNVFKVKVYGTKFDVQAYKEDNDFSAILIKGKVSLTLNSGGIISKEHFLYPDQKAILSEGKDNFLVTEVTNINNYTAWKEGYLIFKNETFQSIIKRVSHYYNIQVELKEEMQVKRLSGKLDLKDDPERVLDGLALISKIKYVKNINKYRFYE